MLLRPTISNLITHRLDYLCSRKPIQGYQRFISTMATTALPVTPAHNLSKSARAEASGLSATVASSSPNYTIPRGEVTSDFIFFAPPSDGAVPFNYVEEPPAGQPVRNFGELVKPMVVHDVRGQESRYNLDNDAFEVIQDVAPSAEKEFVDDASIATKYYPEVEKLLLDHIPGAERVFIFDHTIRRSDPNSKRGPVNRVHIDQTAAAAELRVRHHLPEEADALLKGRYRIINVWRPLNGPVAASPLAFASSQTVRDEDVVPVEHRYPTRTGYTAGVKYNEGQKWHYWSGMQNNERLLLECFDSEALKKGSSVKGGRVPHTAFTDPRTPENAPGRESIEVRTLVFGP